MTTHPAGAAGTAARGALRRNKVPEITIFFWVIKILCTTVGETAADFLNVNLDFGLTATSIVTGLLLVVSLGFQFSTQRYVPAVYWIAVALISVFGTLVTDNLTDSVGVPLEASTLIFTGLLAITFLAWYRSEKTLSIHCIFTVRREAFYWLTILFTFALGTAAGDLMSEGLGLGYVVTGLIVAGVVAVTAVGWKLGMDAILSFWIIYILTRPLGASIGDYLSQPPSHGGLGLGSTLTSAIFLGGILVIVSYLAITRVDVTPASTQVSTPPARPSTPGAARWQVGVVLGLILVLGSAGYYLRRTALDDQIAASVADAQGSQSPLGDLSAFRTITQDTLDLLNAADQAGATGRVDDLEFQWDNAQSTLKPRDTGTWNEVDGRIDTVLRELRATTPNPETEKTALTALLTVLA